MELIVYESELLDLPPVPVLPSPQSGRGVSYFRTLLQPQPLGLMPPCLS